MSDGPKARVKVALSVTLRHLSQLMQEPEAFQVDAASPLECLQAMVERYPSIRPWLYDKEGRLLPLAWLFLNDPGWARKLTREDLEKPLKDGDHLQIAFGRL